ncbi:MAG: hypothetical protein RR911_05710 [Oscillospiraceae bacterium]
MLAVMDVGNWQNIIDLKSGVELNEDENKYEAMRKLARENPYPGDMEESSVGWVTKTAQAVIDEHDPNFMFVDYAQPMFFRKFVADSGEKSRLMQERVLADIDSLAKKNGFEKVIVMTMGCGTLKEEISDLGTKGELQSSPWSTQIAGIICAEEGDRKRLENAEQIESFISKEDVWELYKDKAHPKFWNYFPDYIAFAKEGYAFRAHNSHHPKIYMADVIKNEIPVLSSIGNPKRLTNIKPMIEQSIKDGKKVLLAVFEGYKVGEVQPGFLPCDNRQDWYTYRGLSFYTALLSGKPFFETEFAPVFDKNKPKQNKKLYPLSGFFTAEEEDAIGNCAGIRSAAVSSRSMIIHMAANADITLECYSRDHTKMGVMVSFKPEKI